MTRLFAVGALLWLAFGAGAQGQEKANPKADVQKLVGFLEPVETVKVSPAVGGAVAKVNVGTDYGTVVRKGEVLAELDKGPQELAVQQARAELAKAEAGMRLGKAKFELAQNEFQRLKSLVARAAAAESELAAAQGNLDLAKANIEVEAASIELARVAVRRAELALQGCAVLSPIDGVLIGSRVAVGQTVRPDGKTALFTIARTDPTRLVAEANPHVAVQFAKGQSAECRFDAFPDLKVTGRVVAVRPNPNWPKANCSFLVEFELPNPERKLIPGLSGEASIEIDKK